MQQISLLLVHRYQVLVDILLSHLETVPDLVLRGTTDRAERAIEMARQPGLDVVLVEVGIRPGGARFVRDLREAAPAARVIPVGASDREEILELLEAGACGYVPREASLAELCHAVRQAHSGRAQNTPQVVEAVLRRLRELSEDPPLPLASPDPPAGPETLRVLTSKEQQVLHLLARGCSNREIGRRLSISLSTVKMHVHHVFGKLDVRKRRDAVRVAAQTGLLRVGNSGIDPGIDPRVGTRP